MTLNLSSIKISSVNNKRIINASSGLTYDYYANQQFSDKIKFRTELGERFILTKGFDGCLYGYSLEEWAGIEEKIKTFII